MEFRDLKAQYQHLKLEMDAAIATAVMGGQYILGAQVSELEAQLAAYVGVSHCVSCGNGTDALQLALLSQGIGPGDAVFVPDFTFFASAEAIAVVGATPVFVDIDLDTFNMCAKSLEKAIERIIKEEDFAPKAVIAVDLFGLPADYPALLSVCERYNLVLIEDGAQGFGGAIGEKRACSFGHLSTTSFFPAKPLGCYGDGGAVFTNDDKTAEILRSLRVHGKGQDKYDNVRIGMNSRLDTLQAAVLLVKLKAFIKQELTDVNEKAAFYTQELASLVKVPHVPQGYVSSWAQYSILLTDEAQREALRVRLQQAGIPTMVYFPKPMHAQKAFATLCDDGRHCPSALEASQRVLALPMGPYLSTQDQTAVCKEIGMFFQ